MNREEYKRELERRLAGLKEQEIQDALSYCEEYFDEAGIGNEASVIEELGSPAKFAAQIRAEATIRKNEMNGGEGQAKNPRTAVKNVGVIFLGICALPLALPLALTAVILIFVFALVILCLLFALVVTAGAIMMTGLPLVLAGFLNITEAGNAFISIGGGCLAVGGGLLLMLMFYTLLKVSIPAFTNLISGIYHKAKGGNRHEKA